MFITITLITQKALTQLILKLITFLLLLQVFVLKPVIMVPAVLKLYFIGTALSVLAVLYEMVDSIGGLMYVQDHPYMLELQHQTETPSKDSSSRRSGSSVTKRIGS